MENLTSIKDYRLITESKQIEIFSLINAGLGNRQIRDALGVNQIVIISLRSIGMLPSKKQTRCKKTRCIECGCSLVLFPCLRCQILKTKTKKIV